MTRSVALLLKTAGEAIKGAWDEARKPPIVFPFARSMVGAHTRSAEEGIDMWEVKGLSLIIFTVLNAMGVGFLLYVFAQFWKEGHKSKGASRSRSQSTSFTPKAKVVLVMTPIEAGETRQANAHRLPFSVRYENGPEFEEGNHPAGRSHRTPNSMAR